MAITFTKEYYLVSVPYLGLESLAERKERRARYRELLTKAGFKTEYRFWQERQAKAIATKIKNKTGLAMDVGKAFGMNF